MHFVCVFIAPNTRKHSQRRLKVPREHEDNSYAKLFACFKVHETRQQSVLWEMRKWLIDLHATQLHT